jgi:four helix bundle protein
MKENGIKAKSFAFALRIVKLFQFLRDEKHEFVLSRQLLKSGTAIGGIGSGS